MNGVQRSIQELVDPGQHVAVGQVTEIETHTGYGRLFSVTLRPTGQVVQARLAAFGARGGTGIWWPVAVDDEVIVFFPDGQVNRAVILPGPTSSEAKPPSDWDNDTIRIEGSSSIAIEVVSDNVRLGTATATDPVALRSLVQGQLTALKDAINGWTPVPNDGGLALKIALTALFATWPGDTGATKVKAE